MSVSAQVYLSVDSTQMTLPTVGGAFEVVMAGHGREADARLVPFAAHESVGLPAAWAAAGYGVIENMDPDHFVTIGQVVAGVYYPLIWIPPACKCLCGFAIKDLYWKADTADCWVQFWILEG